MQVGEMDFTTVFWVSCKEQSLEAKLPVSVTYFRWEMTTDCPRDSTVEEKKTAKHTQIKKQQPKTPNTLATSQLQEGAGDDSETPCLRECDNGYPHDLGEMC